MNENETLRWPTNLDRAAIVQRLSQVREKLRATHPELADTLVGLDTMAAGQIGSRVIGAINVVQEKPELSDVALQLAMVAMNLKNLK
jgi:sensor histidine kinase regulating citrate/malate metabolism